MPSNHLNLPVCLDRLGQDRTFSPFVKGNNCSSFKDVFFNSVFKGCALLATIFAVSEYFMCSNTPMQRIPLLCPSIKTNPALKQSSPFYFVFFFAVPEYHWVMWAHCDSSFEISRFRGKLLVKTIDWHRFTIHFEFATDGWAGILNFGHFFPRNWACTHTELLHRATKMDVSFRLCFHQTGFKISPHTNVIPPIRTWHDDAWWLGMRDQHIFHFLLEHPLTPFNVTCSKNGFVLSPRNTLGMVRFIPL